MRVRLREPCSGQTWRVDVASPSPTLQNLLECVAAILAADGHHVDDDIIISLNKKDPICADVSTSLANIGIRNGDLLWIISPIHLHSAPSPPISKQEQPTSTQVKVNDDSNFSVESFHLEPPLPPPLWPPGLSIPGHLLKVLCANTDPSSYSTPTDVLILIIHAAMLETGFIQNAHTPRLADGPCTTAKTPHGHDEYQLMSTSVLCTSNMRQIHYTLRNSTTVVGHCTLTCSQMGNSVLAVGVVNELYKKHTLIDLTTTGISFPSGSRRALLHQEQYIDVCPHIKVTTSSKSIIIHDCCELEHRPLTMLWNLRIKDALALPLLTATCIAHKLPPPASLLTMPMEVKENILGLVLDAIDLAALCTTCIELKHLASSQTLWQGLFNRDFPSPPLEVTMSLESKGYKWAYGYCYRERRRIQEEAQRTRRQRRYIMPFGIPYGPMTPRFHPGPNPRVVGGMVGGNYDRLPFIVGGTTGGGGRREGYSLG